MHVLPANFYLPWVIWFASCPVLVRVNLSPISNFVVSAKREPPVRIELTTPGLRDQCSSHWAMEATRRKNSFFIVCSSLVSLVHNLTQCKSPTTWNLHEIGTWTTQWFVYETRTRVKDLSLRGCFSIQPLCVRACRFESLWSTGWSFLSRYITYFLIQANSIWNYFQMQLDCLSQRGYLYLRKKNFR